MADSLKVEKNTEQAKVLPLDSHTFMSEAEVEVLSKQYIRYKDYELQTILSDYRDEPKDPVTKRKPHEANIIAITYLLNKRKSSADKKHNFLTWVIPTIATIVSIVSILVVILLDKDII